MKALDYLRVPSAIECPYLIGVFYLLPVLSPFLTKIAVFSNKTALFPNKNRHKPIFYKGFIPPYPLTRETLSILYVHLPVYLQSANSKNQGGILKGGENMEILWIILYSLTLSVITLLNLVSVPLIKHATDLDKFRLEQKSNVYEELLKILEAENFKASDIDEIESKFQLRASSPVLKKFNELNNNCYLKSTDVTERKKAITQLKIEMLIDLHNGPFFRWWHRHTGKYNKLFS